MREYIYIYMCRYGCAINGLNLPKSGRVEVKINETNNSECYLHDHDVSASLDKYL